MFGTLTFPITPGVRARFALISAVLFAATLVSTRVAAQARHANDVELRENTLHVRQGIVDVSGNALPTDRPELSQFGDEILYTVEEGEPDPVYILSIYHARKQGLNRWESPWLVREGRAGYDDGLLVSWFFPAFTPWSDTIVSGKGTIHRAPDGSVDFLTLATGFLTLSEEGEELETLATGSDLGFPLGEIPQGGRVSPDGRWLAFFAQSTPAVQGLYLLELETGALHRLTQDADHDPVWTASGRTLYFHQLGAAGSSVGRVDLRFSAGVPVVTRKLLDVNMFASEEHPAPVFGTDVLLTHIQNEDGSAELAARRTCAGFAPVPLHLVASEGEILDAKRPATALYGLGAAFMGKLAGDAHYRVFTLHPLTVARLAAQVSRVRCPSPSKR